MPKVSFTSALKRFFPNLKTIEFDANSLEETIKKLENYYPGITSYLVDNSGKLRKHVNIFIGENRIKDRENLSDKIKETDHIYIMQALSGG